MGRFDHLEISAPVPDAGPPAARSPGPVDSGVVDQDTYLERADAAFDLEDYERALGYYSRALQYDLNSPHAWAGQIRCLIELNELPEAITWADRALERFPQSGDVLAARGVAEGRFGRGREALGFVDAAMAVPGGSAYVWVARGDVLIPVNLPNARHCFSKAIELARDMVQVRMWIAGSYRTHRCWHLALEQLRSAATLDPERARCWLWIGRCCEELGDASEADRAYQRALAINPHLGPAQDGLGRLQGSGLLNVAARRIRRFLHNR